VPLGALAAACLVIGIVPVLAVVPALRVGAFVLSQPGVLADPVVVRLAHDAWWVGAAALGMAALAAAVWLAKRRLLRGRITAGETWACGYAAVTPRMQYSASSLAAPLLDAFGPWTGTRIERDERRLATTPRDLVLDGVIRPAWQRIRAGAGRLRFIQQGRLHLYVLYIIAALVGLLAYLAVSVSS
jgi:hydrogenase-4 component B